MNLSIIIPVFNEGKTITRVISKLLATDLNVEHYEIIVVDDNSTDGTLQILKKFQKESNIKVFSHHKNLGKGAGIKTGLNHATGDYFIIQDADLEYDPADIKILTATAKNNKGAVIYGSRFRGRHEDTVFGHKLGNYLLTALTNILYGCELSDMETCYKLIPKTVLTGVKIESQRFNFEPEITAKIMRQGVTILEVPIHYQKRGFSEGKKIKWFRDGIAAAWTLIKYKLI